MVVVDVAVIGTVVVLVRVAAVDALVVVILLVGVVIAVVLVVAVVILVAELVFDYLVADMQNFHVPDPVVVLTIVLVSEHADLLLIPTVARRGGIARGGRACGICSDHRAGAGSTRRTRCARTCRGAHRSWGARAGGTRSACGCSRGICRSRRSARCRTCSGIGRSRGARGGGEIAWPEVVVHIHMML